MDSINIQKIFIYQLDAIPTVLEFNIYALS